MTEQLPERTFGWSNMFVATRESDPREEGDPSVGERDTLARFLRDYRLTLQLKCEGLDAAAMAAQSVPPSDLSLVGLVRHLAAVEHFWFRRVLGGQGAPRLYRFPDGRNEAFDGAVADPAVVAEAWIPGEVRLPSPSSSWPPRRTSALPSAFTTAWASRTACRCAKRWCT